MLYIYPICIYTIKDEKIGIMPDLNIRVKSNDENDIIEKAKEEMKKYILNKKSLPSATELNKISLPKTAEKRRIVYDNAFTTVISISL